MYQLYRCRGCHNAVKSLEKAAKSRGDVKQLAQLRKEQPSVWKRFITLTRIRDEGGAELNWKTDIFTAASVVGPCQPGQRALRAQPLMQRLISQRGSEEMRQDVF